MRNIFSYYVCVLHMNYNEINIYIPILCKHINYILKQSTGY